MFGNEQPLRIMLVSPAYCRIVGDVITACNESQKAYLKLHAAQQVAAKVSLRDWDTLDLGWQRTPCCFRAGLQPRELLILPFVVDIAQPEGAAPAHCAREAD